jgi:hypothetical protein
MNGSPATPTLNAAMRRISAAYERLPEARRPDVNGPGWGERENAIDAAYVARNRAEFDQAVEEWERFALAQFERAAR